MTTPPSAAGWYPDPDGSGGQRYWDGSTWNEHGPATDPAAEESSAWPAELPPWPEDLAEMPSWEDAGKGESIVEVPADAEEFASADAPDADGSDSPGDEDAVLPDAAPAAEDSDAEGSDTKAADAGPEPAEPATESVAPEAPVAPETPEPPDDHAAGPSFAMPFAAEQPTSPVQTQPAGKNKATTYLIAIGALAAVILVGVLVWAFVINKPDTESEATGADETSETVGETTAATDSVAPDTAEGDPATATGQAVDGDVTITSNGVDIVPTVSPPDNELLTKAAAGEFVVVHLTLTNNGPAPATFLADQQILTAGGQTFTPETEATLYLNGISAVLEPGVPVDISFAFDVPPGTPPESLEVHGDLGTPGAALPLN